VAVPAPANPEDEPPAPLSVCPKLTPVKGNSPI